MTVSELPRVFHGPEADPRVSAAITEVLQKCATCDRCRFCVGEFAAERAAAFERTAEMVEQARVEKRTSVMLSGDEMIPRNALHVLVNARERYQVVAETALCNHASKLMAKLGVNVSVVDFDLNDTFVDRLPVLQSLLSAAPDLPVLVLTREPSVHACRIAFQFGVRGLLLKSKALDDLYGAIDRIARGESWLEGPALEKLLRQSSGPQKKTAEDERIALLTKREKEIIEVLACGRSNQQVAQQLFVSEVTVRHHLCAVFEKLGVATRGELIVFAYRHNLADRKFLDGH